MKTAQRKTPGDGRGPCVPGRGVRNPFAGLNSRRPSSCGKPPANRPPSAGRKKSSGLLKGKSGPGNENGTARNPKGQGGRFPSGRPRKIFRGVGALRFPASGSRAFDAKGPNGKFWDSRVPATEIDFQTWSGGYCIRGQWKQSKRIT